MFHKKFKTILRINGMHCKHCAKKVEGALSVLASVTKVKVNLDKKEVTILSNEQLDEDVIKQLITELDYQLIDISK